MKIFQAQIDCMFITLIAETKLDAFNLLKENDKRIYIENDTFKYKWDEKYSEIFAIEEVPMLRSIIQWERH
jgi:hypothetical protein